MKHKLDRWQPVSICCCWLSSEKFDASSSVVCKSLKPFASKTDDVRGHAEKTRDGTMLGVSQLRFSIFRSLGLLGRQLVLQEAFNIIQFLKSSRVAKTSGFALVNWLKDLHENSIILITYG